MIRPILAETKRYGEYSKPGESVFDHPFQWGSRRIGPDLAREGGKQSALWHVRHFQDPINITPGSIMPRFPWLLENRIDFDVIPRRMAAMRTLGVPYSDDEIRQGAAAARRQAAQIAKKIADDKGPAQLDEREVVALIAYVDRLGRDLFAAPPQTGAR
jgi:cytochrome c oxidase cbb3-type subunit I/II